MLRERGRQLHLAFIALDITITVAAFSWLTTRSTMLHPSATTETGLVTLTGMAIAVALAWPLLLGRFGAYQSQRRERIGETLARLLGANGLGALLLSTVAFAIAAPIAPSFPLVLSAIIFTAQASFRIPLYASLQAARRTGHNSRNLLVIGTGPRAARARVTIDQHPEWGLRILGFVDEGQSNFVPHVPLDRIHKMIELPDLLRDKTVDEVLVACPRSMLDALVPVVQECAEIGVPVTLLTDLFGDELPPPRVGRFDSQGTITFAPVHHDELELTVKRGLDILGAVVGVVISAPLIVLAALCIRGGDSGPVLFKQWRCGLNGRRFQMLKLRTMIPGAEAHKADLMHLNEMDGPVFKIKDDPRVTPVGRFLRKWSIDELPQFWNVLRGDMSLVGPRPPTPDEVVLYEGSERRRLSMRPGLTSLWQVEGRNEVSFEEWMRLDLEYIDTWGVRSDIRIILRTLPRLLTGRGAS